MPETSDDQGGVNGLGLSRSQTPLRALDELLPAWWSILLNSKAFFSSTGSASILRLENAFRFFMLAIATYVVLLSAFELILNQVWNYSGSAFLPYFQFEIERLGIPLASVFAVPVLVAYFGAVTFFGVLGSSVSLWTFLNAFSHHGELTPFKPILTAGLYFSGFVILTVCALSLPLVSLGDADEPLSVFYAFGPWSSLGNLETKYFAVILYFYLRAISFTTNTKLHWGMIFSILLFYAGLQAFTALSV